MRILTLALALALSAGAPAWAGSGDGPEISRSTGRAGGVVVLWPRVVPQVDTPDVRAATEALRARMVALGEEMAGSAADVRPEPERVCPRAGCRAVSLGAVLAHQGKGCAVAALLGPVGANPVRIVPWAGRQTLSAPTIAFRGAPETMITVDDFAPCAALSEALDAGRGAVADALRAALGAP